MIDIKKLTQQKNELKEVWDYLALAAEFPDKQVRLWLLDYPKDMIESAFKVLAKKEEKINEPVKYIGRILHNAKNQNMTPEERAAQISTLRSAVGTLGAAKRHAKEIAYIKQEFAEVCQDLPEVCRSLAADNGIGSGSGLDSVSGSGTLCGTEQSTPAAAAPPVVSTSSQAKKEKGNTNTKTENPFASGLKPIRRCKSCNGILRRNVNHVCPPSPTCFDCGADEFDHQCGADEAN